MQILRTSNTAVSKSQKTLYVVLLFILISGIAIGSLALLYPDSDTLLKSEILHHNFIISGSVEIYDSFIRCIKFPLLIILLLFLCGFSAVFQPVELCLVLWHGVSIGLSVSYYYAYFGIRGFFIALMLVMPFSLMLSMLIIVGGYNAFNLSSAIGKLILCDDGKQGCLSIRFYALKFFVLCMLAIILSIIESLAIYALKGIL